MNEHFNKALVRDFFGSIDKGNLSRVKELLTTDFLLHAPGESKPVGVDDLIRDIKEFYTAFPDSTHVIDDMVVEGDKVAVRLNQYGTHKEQFQGIPATGRKIAAPAIVAAETVKKALSAALAVGDSGEVVYTVERSGAGGKAPKWALVTDSVKATCQRCSLVDVASADVCRDCPLVDFLNTIMEAE